MRREGRLAAGSATAPMRRLVMILERACRSALARMLAGSFLVASVARLAQLAMAVLLAHRLGPAGYGTFTFALGAAIVLGQLSSLGWPTAMARQIPMCVAARQWQTLAGRLGAADIVVGAAGLTSSALVLCAAMSGLFPGRLSEGASLAALLVLPIGFRLLRRQELTALRHPTAGIAFDELIAPMVVVVLLLAFPRMSVVQALLCYAAASASGVVLSSALVQIVLPPGVRVSRGPRYPVKWTLEALPLAISVFGQVALNRIDVIMLGPMTTVDQVGLYSAAFRVTFLVGFAPQVLSTVMWPVIAELHSRRDGNRLISTMVLYTAGTAVVSLAVALPLLVLSREVVEWVFGPGFAAAVPVLRVLILAQAMAAVTTTATSILLMTGGHKAHSVGLMAGVAIDLVLNSILIPNWHALGAAIATLAASAFLLGVLAFLSVTRVQKMRIDFVEERRTDALLSS